MVTAKSTTSQCLQFHVHGQQQILCGGRPGQAQEPPGPQRLQHGILQEQPRSCC